MWFLPKSVLPSLSHWLAVQTSAPRGQGSTVTTVLRPHCVLGMETGHPATSLRTSVNSPGEPLNPCLEQQGSLDREANLSPDLSKLLHLCVPIFKVGIKIAFASWER